MKLLKKNVLGMKMNCLRDKGIALELLVLAMGSEKIHPFSWRDIDIDIDFCAIDWGCSQDTCILFDGFLHDGPAPPLPPPQSYARWPPHT